METVAKLTPEQIDSGQFYVSAEDLYKAYQPDLVRHIMLEYRVPLAEAEDFTQDLFRKVLGRDPPGFKPATDGVGQSPRTFLRSLLGGDVKNYRRLAARTTTTVTAPADLPDRAAEDELSASQRFAREQFLERWYQETEGLNPKLLRVFQLSVYERLTYPQIAELLGIPEGTVGSRLTEARKMLKPVLQRLRRGGSTIRLARG